MRSTEASANSNGRDTTQAVAPSPYTLLRLPEVLRIRGRCRSSHYTDIQHGLFTPPVSIGARCVAWPASEVEALNLARISGFDEAGIRDLVRRLVIQRSSVA